MGKITVIQHEAAFDTVAAWRIISAVEDKADAVIGLSTGRTTKGLHQRVVEIHADYPFDVSRVTFFGQDEIAGVPRDYWGACYTMLKTEIIDGLGIPDDRFRMLPTASDDFEASCRAFTEGIDRRGGIDLLMLGLGENGHIGFNQPGTPFDAPTRLAGIHPELEARVRRDLSLPDDAPLGGVTLGLKDAMRARKVVLVAKGRHKAEAVRHILRGPLTPEWPGSLLQLHPACEYLLDAEAASLL